MQLIQSPLLQRNTQLQDMVRFRFEFDLTQPVAPTTVAVTADTNYLLFLNGIEVGRGSARHFQNNLPVQLHDLTLALKPGKNVLCALVRHLHLDTFSYLRGNPCFGLEGAIGALDLSTRNGRWMTSTDTCFHPFSPRINMHLGPLENQQSSPDGLLGWTLDTMEPSNDWTPAQDLRNDPRALHPSPVPPLQCTHIPLGQNVRVLGSFDALPTRSGFLYAVPDSNENALTELTVTTTGLDATAGVSIGVRGLGAVLDPATGHASKVFPYGHHSAEGTLHCHGSDLSTGIRLITCQASHVLISIDEKSTPAVSVFKTGGRPLPRAFESFRESSAETLTKAPFDREPAPMQLHPVGEDCLYAWGELRHAKLLSKPSPFGTGVTLQQQGIVLDLGRFYYGHIQIDFESENPTQVEIGYGHELAEDGFPRVFNWDRIRLPSGTAQFQNLFTARGMRYVFLSTSGHCRLGKIQITEALLPEPDRNQQGRFHCNDQSWNRIWNCARETVRYSRIDVVSSDSFREFCAWLGDTHWIGRNYFYTFATPQPLRYTWELYAQSVDEAGRMSSVVPGYAFFNLPVWTWQFWMGVWEYYLYTGDEPFLASMFRACTQTHRYYQQFKSPHGLLHNPPEWRIVDWAKIDLDGESFVLNAIYRRAVLQLARSAAALGHPMESALRREAEQLRESLADPRFESHEQRLFFDGVTNEKPNRTFSQHAQILAYDLGLWRERDHGNLISRLLQANPTRPLWTLGEPSFHWAADILGKHPDFPRLGQLIHDVYRYQLDSGATCLGHRHPGSVPGQFRDIIKSPCHGWASSPIYLSGSIALGVAPSSPGYQTVRVAPRPLYSNMTEAEGSVPTPHGPIHVAWKLPNSQYHAGFIEVSLPSGMTGELDLSAPEWSPFLSKKNVHHILNGASPLRISLILPKTRQHRSHRVALTARA